MCRYRQRAQSLVEFSLTVGLLMLVAVSVAQVAIFLHYRSSLDLSTREGAYEGSLVGHGPADAKLTTQELWAKLEPGGGPIQVSVTVEGRLIVVDAKGYAPALMPLPIAPFTHLTVSSHSVHTLELFEPGSLP